MFGNPKWFRPKTFGFGLTPITCQGWLYTGAWVSALVLPFWALVWKYQVQGEAGLGVLAGLTWVGAGLGVLWYDVRTILHAMKSPAAATAARSTPKEDNVLYIGPETGATEMATRNFDMRLRR